MTSCGSDLTQTQSHTSGELPEDGPFKIQSPLADISSIAAAETQLQLQGASRPDFPEEEGTSRAEGESVGLKTGGDTASTTSDTERSDDGKEKDTKKIQTTTTTQVWLCVFFSGVIQQRSSIRAMKVTQAVIKLFQQNKIQYCTCKISNVLRYLFLVSNICMD